MYVFIQKFFQRFFQTCFQGFSSKFSLGLLQKFVKRFKWDSFWNSLRDSIRNSIKDCYLSSIMYSIMYPFKHFWRFSSRDFVRFYSWSFFLWDFYENSSKNFPETSPRYFSRGFFRNSKQFFRRCNCRRNFFTKNLLHITPGFFH